MGKSLIITEKPSVAQEFAKVLKVSGRKDGYIENSDYVITWCIGHLVGLVYPESYDMKYKKWKLEDLPFLPQKKDRRSRKIYVISVVCVKAWKNFVSGSTLRQKRKSFEGFMKQNRCQSMLIWENPVSCGPLKIMRWELIFHV